MRTLVWAALAAMATPAWAEMDYVTDRALCGLEPIDRSERGMTFTGSDFYEIEYYCELKEPFPPVDGQDYTHITLGFCEGPGELFPSVFVLRSFQFEPGVLYVYQDDTGDGTTFFKCPQQ